MINLCNYCPAIYILQEDSSNIDYTTIIIAFITICITVYVVYLGKRVEIGINKFNKLCLEPLESKFGILSEIFEKNRNDFVFKHLSEINAINNDLILVLIQIKEIYKYIDIDELQDISHDFSDKAFLMKNEKIYSIQGDFLSSKIKILDKIYNYALYKELRFFKLLRKK